jgi:hypothetical protein
MSMCNNRVQTDDPGSELNRKTLSGRDQLAVFLGRQVRCPSADERRR